jgi:hypothetical protein
MSDRFSGALAVAAALLVAPRLEAQAAQQFGHAGSLAIGAERLSGIATTHSEATLGSRAASVDFERDTFSLALLANDPATPFVTPRIGADYFVIDRLSAGGFIGYASHSSESAVGSASSKDSASAIIFGVRGGYAVMLSELFGLWPRAGFTFVRGKSEQVDDEIETSIFALSAEALLLIVPLQQVAFTAGPTADYTLTGGGQSEDAAGDETDVGDLRVHTFALQAGLVVWF